MSTGSAPPNEPHLVGLIGYGNVEASSGVVLASLGMTSLGKGQEFFERDALVAHVKLLMVDRCVLPTANTLDMPPFA